jgi:hypothetical protein
MTETYSENDYIQDSGGMSKSTFGQQHGKAGRYENKKNALNLTTNTSKGWKYVWGGQTLVAHSEPYTRDDALQAIFPKYQPNVLDYDPYLMGAVKIGK